jgi:hypothetical protein
VAAWWKARIELEHVLGFVGTEHSDVVQLCVRALVDSSFHHNALMSHVRSHGMRRSIDVVIGAPVAVQMRSIHLHILLLLHQVIVFGMDAAPTSR